MGQEFVIKSTTSDKDLIFKGNDGGSEITALTLDMSDAGTATFNHDVLLGDASRIKLGAGNDLQIYHDGSDSLILDSGTGDLKILGSSNVRLQNQGDNQDMLVATGGGAVELYHNASKKIETTSSGVDVTGTVTADGLTVNSGTTNTNTTFQSTDALPEGTKHGDVVDEHRGVKIVAYMEGNYNELIYALKFQGTDYVVTSEWYEDVDHYGYSGALALIKESIDFDTSAFRKAKKNGTPLGGPGSTWYGKDAKKPVPKDAKGVKLSAQETLDAY